MKEQFSRLASRFFAIVLAGAMMGSLAVSAGATSPMQATTDPSVGGMQDAPAPGADTCKPTLEEPTRPSYLEAKLPPDRQEANPSAGNTSSNTNGNEATTEIFTPSSGVLGEPPLPETTTSPIEAKPETVYDPNYNTATQVSAEQLFTLVYCLRDVYYLEARVYTLKDYSAFDPNQGYFTFKNDSDQPKSICEYLTSKECKELARLTTYQAYLFVQNTPEYKQNAELKALVDKSFQNFCNIMPNSVRESLVGFVPRTISNQLDPDQLCVIGDLIVKTEGYQGLKAALSPVRDCYGAKAIEQTFSPAEITLLYDEIMQAALKVWPHGVPERNLYTGVRADGKIGLVPLPSTSTGA